MRNFHIILIVILFSTLFYGCPFNTENQTPNPRTIVSATSWNLKMIDTSLYMYKKKYGTYPYAPQGNSDTVLLSLLKEEPPLSQLEHSNLVNPKTKHEDEIFYETFNLSKEEWCQLDEMWEKCRSNANFSVKELPPSPPTLWEKELIHDSDKLFYIRGIQYMCKDGKNFLKLVKKVKEEIKASRAKTAKELKEQPTPSNPKP